MGGEQREYDPEPNTENKRDNEAATSRRKKIAWFVVYVLWMVLDVEGVWSISHVYCLLAACGGTIAISLAEFDSILSNGIVTASVVLVSGLVYLLAPPILPFETETHGWLLPGSQQIPQSQCVSLSHAPEDALVFIAGSNVFVNTNPGATPIISLDGEVLISVTREGRKLAFDADLHDDNGLLVARIEHNEFHLVTGEYSYQKRSDDRSTLAVYDRRGIEVLYVDYANLTTVYIRGTFVGRNGTKAEVSSEAVRVRKRGMNINLIDTCSASGNEEAPGFDFSADGTSF